MPFKNKQEQLEYHRKWRSNNKDRIKKYWHTKWKHDRTTISKRLWYKIFNSYGISREDFDRMILAQLGRCAICDSEPKNANLHIDHDHKTGRFRGLLCGQCNRGIGLLRESKEIMLNAIAYLNGEK